mgnify:CR=1 FL=1
MITLTCCHGHLIGKDPNLAFSPGTGPRRSITPTTELQWYERLLEEFKEEVAEKERELTAVFLTFRYKAS